MSRAMAVMSLVLALVGGFAGYALSGVTRVEPLSAPSSEADDRASDRTIATPVPASAEEMADAERAMSSLRGIPLSREYDRSGEITGVVRTLDGDPVEGMTIRARCSSNGPIEEVKVLESTAEEWVLASARLYQFRNEFTVDATTDALGAYTLTEISPELEYYVYTPDDGVWILDSATRDGSRGATAGAALDHVAIPLGDLELDVHGFDESAADHLFVRVTPVVAPSGEGTASRPADLESRADLVSSMSHRWRPDDRRTYGPAGLCRIEVADMDHAMPEPVLVELVQGETVAVRLDVERRFMIRGEVRLGGLPIESGRVRIVRGAFSSKDDPELQRLIEDEGHGNPAKGVHLVWLQDGRYGAQVGRGMHTICFEQDWGQIKSIEVVDVDRDLRVDADFDLDLSRTLLVRVTDPAGNATEANFNLQYRSKNSSGSTSLNAQRVEPGQYRLLIDNDDFERFGPTSNAELSLEVQSYFFGRQSIDIELGQSYDFQFEEPGTLRVDLPGLDGHPYRSSLNLSVEQRSADGSSTRGQGSRSLAEHEDAELTFSSLAPGEYFVVLENRMEEYYSGTPVAEVAVVVTGGEQSVVLPVPPLYTVTIRADGIEHGGSLTKVPDGPSSDPAAHRSSLHLRGEDGVFVVRGLSAGSYELQFWGNDGGTMNFDVRGDMTVDFVPKAIDRLRVTIEDSAGEIAKAGFQSGDQIVALDGTRFTNQQSMMQAFMGAFAKESVTLTILRNGSEFELSLDPKLILQPTPSAGAHFEPDGQ